MVQALTVQEIMGQAIAVWVLVVKELPVQL